MKRIYIIVTSITIFLIILLGIILMPYFRQKQYTSNLKKEVNMVANYVNRDKGSLENIKNYINKDVTDGNFKKLEKSIDKYLTDVVENYENYNKILNKNGDAKLLLNLIKMI